MTLSQITAERAFNFARAENQEELALFEEVFLPAARAYVQDYTAFGRGSGGDARCDPSLPGAVLFPVRQPLHGGGKQPGKPRAGKLFGFA